MKIVDANIVLRYLLNDVKDLADRAALIIENDEVIIPVEIIAEIVYVLEKVYKVGRADIFSSISGLMNYDNIFIVENEVVYSALRYYAGLNIDFVDCLLLSYHVVKQYQVDTFDEKLKRRLEIEINNK